MSTNIFALGCPLPDLVTSVDMYSTQSLLDAEIILIWPTFRDLFAHNRELRDQHNLSEQLYPKVANAVQHWTTELRQALEVGSTALVMLPDYRRFFHQHRAVATNYDFLPFRLVTTKSNGKSMSLMAGDNPLRPVWDTLADLCEYQVYINSAEPLKPLVSTSKGSQLVGGIHTTEGGGTLVVLPWIEPPSQRVDSRDGIMRWFDAEIEQTRVIAQVALAINEAIKAPITMTQMPDWASQDAFSTSKERELTNEKSKTSAQISELEQQLRTLEDDIKEASVFKQLLFEQGAPLEDAVHRAMEVLGFTTSRYRQDNSEFDIVLEETKTGQRFLGEVEGRDNHAIAVGKIRQLALNVLEDFEREEVTTFAKPILLGNAYRLLAPEARPAEQFTPKCVEIAKLIDATLVRTVNLFHVVQTLIDHPNSSYAASCRQAILDARGREVVFPSAPDDPQS